MKRAAGLSAVALAVAAAATVRAAPPPPVQTALAMLAQGSNVTAEGWRFKETIKDSRGTMKLAYRPLREPGHRWRILTVNGEEPGEAARERLSAKARKAAKAAGRWSGPSLGWLSASRYRLIKKTHDTLVYQLRPRASKRMDAAGRKLMSHLAGKLVIARGDYRPLSLRLDNFESFSPRFGVKVTSFGLRIEFKRLNESGPVVVVHTSNSVAGEIFWFNSFKNKTEVTLSDFEPVATPAPGARTGG